MEITNKELRKALDKAGLATLKLWRGDGYLFWYSDDPITSNALYATGVSTVVLVCFFHHLSIARWVEEAKSMMAEIEQFEREYREYENEQK